MATQPSDEPSDMKLLRQRLKIDARTKPGTLAAAAALARDSGLDAAKVFDEHKVPPGSHTRAKALAERIAREALLEHPDRSDAENQWLPADTLLVTGAWITTNAPGLLNVVTDPLVISTDGKHATRVVRAHLADCGEVQLDEIDYDLTLKENETQTNRDEKHRLREKACIRRLDAAAAEARRIKKIASQRERRADETAVRCVLDRIIVRLERQAQMVLQAQMLPLHWQCPAGCTDHCARVSFRQQCLPSAGIVSSSLRQLWESKRITPFGKFVGPSALKHLGGF